MALRRSTLYLGLIALLLLAVAGTLLHASAVVRSAQPAWERKGALVRRLGLTDLALFTEATYTRNPAMTDLAAPFQDSPLSMEHFPSGSLIQPPLHTVTRDAQRH